MLLSAVSVLVVAQSSSEIPEGLMNNPVCVYIYIYIYIRFVDVTCTVADNICNCESVNIFKAKKPFVYHNILDAKS